MAQQPPPPSARRHYATGALLAQRVGAQAAKATKVADLWTAIVRGQVAAVALAHQAMGNMLTEQDIESPPEALLVPLSFTTTLDSLDQMLEAATREIDEEYLQLLASSLITDAMRAAETVDIATRRDIGFVRHVTPPCCPRCAVLSGRFYRWSDGFERHPGCDCVHIPTTVAGLVRDPQTLVEEGLVKGLSKADLRAISEGADVAQVVNVRRTSAGLTESGRVLRRGSRATPEAIFRRAGDDRELAMSLLKQAGYIR